jgi:hypothetical protein
MLASQAKNPISDPARSAMPSKSTDRHGGRSRGPLWRKPRRSHYRSLTRRTQPEGCGRPSHSVVPNNSHSRCTLHSQCSARSQYRRRTGCKQCMPRTQRIPGRPDTTQSTDCQLPRRCLRCLPSRLPRRCPRSLPSRLPRRCPRWRSTQLPRHYLQSRPSPRLRRCPCWRSSPQLGRCQGQPLNPTELPQTHHPSRAMTFASFCGCSPTDTMAGPRLRLRE